MKVIAPRKNPLFVAGVDASFIDDTVIAAASLYTYPGLKHIQDAYVKEKARFPYIPGFLAFREGPAVIKALKKLRTLPDVILFDGQGIAHPRGLGIASHIGVILAMPTIGCAKSRLVGEFNEPDENKGAWTYLYYKKAKVGAVLRTRSGARPVFASPGHLIDIKSSVEILMNCILKYRVPEPIRRADSISRSIRKHLTKSLQIL